MSTRFIEEPHKPVIHELPESLRRKQNACSRIHRSYIFNRTSDKNVLETSVLVQKYPEHVHDSLVTLFRLKLVPNMFEIDEKTGAVDEQFKTKEALIWVVRRTVRDPLNPTTQDIAHCTIKHGIYQSPQAIIETDESGNVTKSEIAYWRNTAYIPFSEEKAKEVVAEYNGIYRNTVVAYATEQGDSFTTGASYEVPNFKEWCTVDLDTLAASSRAGVLVKDFGGHVRFLKDQEQKRKQLEAEVASYTATGKKSK